MRVIRAELNRAFSAKSFWLVCGIMLALPLYEGGNFIYYRRTGAIVTSWWTIYLRVIEAPLFFSPILVMFTYAVSYRRERDCGYSQLMMLRSTGKAYLGAKALAVASTAFMAVLLPFLCWMPVCRLLGVADPAYDRDRHNIYFALSFYDQNPGLYCVAYTLYVAVVGAVFAIFGLGLSSVVKNKYLALFLPFGYCVFSGIVLSPSLEAFRLLKLQSYHFTDRCPLGYWTAPLYMTALTAAGLGMFVSGDRLRSP